MGQSAAQRTTGFANENTALDSLPHESRAEAAPSNGSWILQGVRTDGGRGDFGEKWTGGLQRGAYRHSPGGPGQSRLTNLPSQFEYFSCEA